MTARLTRLGNILQPVSPMADASSARANHRVIALPRGQGIGVKAARHHDETALIAGTRVHTGQFVIAKRHLHRGSWGIVPPEHDGAVASNAFYVFDLSFAVDPAYFAIYLNTASFQHAARGVIRRSGRLYWRDFKGISLWIPARAEQQKVIRLWDAWQAALQHTQTMIDAVAAIKRGVAADLLTRTNPAWETTTLDQCAEIITGGDGVYPLALNRSGDLRVDAPISSGGFGIRPTADINVHFLRYWLEYHALDLTRARESGAAFPLLLPTLYEQHKIVSTLQLHEDSLAALRDELDAQRGLRDEVLTQVFSGNPLPPDLVTQLAAVLRG